MLLNYIKLTIRILIRNPFFTFINVFGLSVGFAVFFILWLYSSNELESDQFRKDWTRIYRLRVQFDFSDATGPIEYLCGTFPPHFAQVVSEKFGQIESMCRIANQNNFNLLRHAEHHTNIFFSWVDAKQEKHSFIEDRTAYADSNLFDFFSIPLLSGDPERALSSPNAIVLSNATARKYFGDEDPMGKMLLLNDRIPLLVSGVFEDHPNNSHLTFEIVISALRIKKDFESTSPFLRNSHCYFKVREGASVTELERIIDKEGQFHYDEMLDIHFPGSLLKLFLQPLHEVPFRVFDNDAFVPKSRYLLLLFRSISILVLVMAWINYLNLNLSAQAKRLKEFAARKAVGARPADFTKQFLLESVLVHSITLFTAITLIQILENPLQILLHFYVPDWSSISSSTVYFFSTIIILGIVLTGVYPIFSAVKLSSLKLIGGWKPHSKSIKLSNLLTSLQYICAFTLIAWLFSVNNQVDFLLTNDLGINRDRVIIVDLPNQREKNFDSELGAFKQELLHIDGVQDCALSSNISGDKTDNIVTILRKGSQSGANVNSEGGIDERFVPFYGINLIAGRNFSFDNPSNESQVLISPVAAMKIGLDPDEAVGKEIVVNASPAEIIGVIEDYKHKPLFMESSVSTANKGLVLTYGVALVPRNTPNKVSIRTAERNFNQTITQIRKTYNEIFDGQIFHWYFLDDHINIHYNNERISRNQIVLFTSLAICLACLGLLGMITNKAVGKTKEIGIRKVLGAKLADIGQLLLNTTIRQVIISMVLGVPVTYYLTLRYLEQFSERISIQWWHYVFPAVILMIIMFCTIASVLWKAAKTNPVESLRYE